MRTSNRSITTAALTLLMAVLPFFPPCSADGEKRVEPLLELKTLSLETWFMSLTMKLSYPVNKGSFEVCGATVAIERRKKDFAWQCGESKGTFKSLPTVI